MNKTFFENLFKRVESIADGIVLVFMLCMVAVVFVNAILRYAFSYSLVWSEEVGRYLFMWVCYMGAVSAYYKSEHIRVTFITDKLGHLGQQVCMYISNILSFFMICLICYGSFKFVKMGMHAFCDSFKWLPIGYIYLCTPIMCIAMLLKDIYKFVVFVASAIRDRRGKGETA